MATKRERLMAMYQDRILDLMRMNPASGDRYKTRFTYDAAQLGIGVDEAEELYAEVTRSVQARIWEEMKSSDPETKAAWLKAFQTVDPAALKKSTDASLNIQPPDPLLGTARWVTIVLSALLGGGVVFLSIKWMERTGTNWTDYAAALVFVFLSVMSLGLLFRDGVYALMCQWRELNQIRPFSLKDQWICNSCGLAIADDGREPEECPRCSGVMVKITTYWGGHG